MADIWNLPEDEKIILECNELGQPIGNEGGTFSLFGGTLVRDKNIMPIDYTDWRNVPHRHKDDAWSILQVLNFCFTLVSSIYFVTIVKLKQ
jgi:hypothetical protein